MAPGNCGVRTMLNYRFNLIREDGHVAGPPQDFDFSDDYDAVKAAEKLLDGRDIEIWQSMIRS
jgi:hypothetical protein